MWGHLVRPKQEVVTSSSRFCLRVSCPSLRERASETYRPEGVVCLGWNDRAVWSVEMPEEDREALEEGKNTPGHFILVPRVFSQAEASSVH